MRFENELVALESFDGKCSDYLQRDDDGAEFARAANDAER